MSREELGCCGAYCRTCPVLAAGMCAGCKLGYRDGTRDIAKAKCKMKVCCMTNGRDSCAECPDYESCAILGSFFAHTGYKYKKYRQALEYIREHGYEEFLAIADTWERQYGKYP